MATSMRFVETTAFVLRTHALGEADRIVTLFSRAAGKLRGVAPQASSSRKRFGGALSMLAEVEVRFRQRTGRDLGRLERCTPLRATPGGGSDVPAFYAAAYISEVLQAFSREGDADDHLYRLVQSTCDALEAQVEAYGVCRYFDIWTLKLAGLLPDLRRCARCSGSLARVGAVATDQGEVVCPACCPAPAGTRRRLSPSALTAIERFIALPPRRALDGSTRVQALRDIGTFASNQYLTLTDRPFRTAAALVPGRSRAGVPA
ncbi:MAG: DNA repair protein RecO [Acidobacteriota bacterium]